MDAFEDTPTTAADPAAEFLAREQEELGDLGEELGINSTNADDNPVQVDIANLSLEDRQEIEEVNREGEVERTNTPSPAFIMPPRPKEEPETIRLWREQQGKLLEEKDAKEAEMMAKMKAEAEQELKDW